MNECIRVLVADDHVMVRQGLCSVIADCDDMQVVGEASDGIEVVDKACLLSPDVIVMDLVMPRQNGVEAIKQVRRLAPDVKILALTSFSRETKALHAIDAGAMGFLLKDSPCDVLIEAIRKIHQGQPFLQSSVALGVAHELFRKSQRLNYEELTRRESEVLELVAQGLSNLEIADALSISEVTVAGHVGNILGKLHLNNRTQAALYALREGIVDLQ